MNGEVNRPIPLLIIDIGKTDNAMNFAKAFTRPADMNIVIRKKKANQIINAHILLLLNGGI